MKEKVWKYEILSKPKHRLKYENKKMRKDRFKHGKWEKIKFNIENEKIRRLRAKKIWNWNNTIQWKENKYVNKPNIEKEKREA